MAPGPVVEHFNVIEEIDNHRQIQPALPDADISSTGDPELIGPDNGELPLHAIRSNGQRYDVALYRRTQL